MKAPSFKIISLGCKISLYDAAVLRRELVARGFKEAKGAPDLIIANTCAVTRSAIAKDRNLIRRLRAAYPLSLIIVAGCWPETYDAQAELGSPEGILFFGVGRIKEILSAISKRWPVSGGLILESGLLAPTDRSRYFLKVGDGCNQFCAYCIIPFARGRLHSRSEREIMSEARAAVEAGYREIVLSGIHLGQYGQDFKAGKTSLVALLDRLLRIKGLGRIRLSSIEINEINDELIALMSESDKLCRHLHISLQSGSDKILRAMGRPYTSSYFKRRVKAIRKAMPDIALSTDIIVGFPGESERDFAATYDFAASMAFSKIHVFSFSAHDKTRAAKLEERVAPALIKERSEKLRRLSAKLEEDYRSQILQLYTKRPLGLTLEAGAPQGKIRAKTEYHFDLLLSQKELKKHRLI